MKLPKKAVRYSELRFSSNTKIQKSGHPVSKIHFKDLDGKEKLAFYKPLDQTYPELLAKYSVSASVILRLSLGELAAEERLVFNDDGKIVGTISIALPNYRPVDNAHNNTEEDKELANPSTMTLLKHNIARLLVKIWAMKDDDLHIFNLSLSGEPSEQNKKQEDLRGIAGLFGKIDNDMIWYPITSIIKGGRFLDDNWVRTLDQKFVMELRSKDIDNFPNINGRTHWPANSIPMNFNYLKQYSCSESFQKLAGNPKLELTNDETISFQQQLFEAYLMELLVFEPELIKNRLSEYFADMLLDFLSLPSEKSEKLSSFDKELFNTETDKGLFIDHMMVFLQKEYDELYSTIVLYTGCKKNTYQVRVPAFHEFLDKNPLSFGRIKTWLLQENERMEKSGLYKDNFKPLAFDIAAIEYRYHQIWRDSHMYILNSIRFKYETLTFKLMEELRLSELKIKRNSSLMEHKKLRESSQLIVKPRLEFEKSSINCDPSSEIAKGLIDLIAYINDVYQLSLRYANTPRHELSMQNNKEYCDQLEKLSTLYAPLINHALTHTKWKNSFIKLQDELNIFIQNFELEKHLNKKSLLNHKIFHLLEPNHTEPSIIKSCANIFFDWAKNCEVDLLVDLICNIIDKHYDPSNQNIPTNRQRAQIVKQYLKNAKSSKEEGDNILAYILSEGGCKDTSLNTKLVKYLIPFMFRNILLHMDIYLKSIHNAIENNTFNLGLYTECICHYAKNDLRFSHLLSKRQIMLFNKTMYEWVNTLNKKEFNQILNKTLQIYDKNKILFIGNWFKTRGSSIEKYLKSDKPNATILALIFSEGEMKKTSFNTHLFHEILTTMARKALIYPHHEGFTLVSTLCDSDKKKIYLKTLKEYTKEWTYYQSKPSINNNRHHYINSNFEDSEEYDQDYAKHF